MTGIDEKMKHRAWEALRFASSRSVISSAEEQAILAALSHPEPGAQETGWLIELRGSRPTWWSLHPDEEPGWLRDANKALRFARKEDAEAYISDAGWNDAFATEHKWI